MVARQLIEQYGMKQELVAAKLGVTQAAISKYQHQVRGEAVELEMAIEVQAMSRDIASVLSHSSDPLAISQKFAQACTDIRALGLMCETCSRVDPSWDVEHCTICFGHHSCSETISIDSSSMAKYRKIPIRS
jgi:predicted transcriptional regulator